MPNLAHFAINADDVARARQFYERAFGWTFHAWGPPNFYQIQTGSKEDPGVMGALQGRRALIEGQRTIGFECTIGVPSIDATEQAVLANGGRIVMPRSIISGVGTLMFFQDTEGNVFGAMQYDANAE
jgi:predicted enzyme related to lactoylglutathione lyase